MRRLIVSRCGAFYAALLRADLRFLDSGDCECEEEPQEEKEDERDSSGGGGHGADRRAGHGGGGASQPLTAGRTKKSD